MSNSKSDKPLVRNMIITCVLAILIFHFAWFRHLGINLGNWVFTIVDGGLIAAFIVESIGAYRYADDPNKEWKRWVVVITAAALCIWAGGWAAGVNERVL